MRLYYLGLEGRSIDGTEQLLTGHFTGQGGDAHDDDNWDQKMVLFDPEVDLIS